MSVPDETTPHILIVDDDTRIRELLKKYLNDNGYRTSAAADAAQAQERMGALTYDLLVLDVMMLFCDVIGVRISPVARSFRATP